MVRVPGLTKGRGGRGRKGDGCSTTPPLTAGEKETKKKKMKHFGSPDNFCLKNCIFKIRNPDRFEMGEWKRRKH